MVELRKIVKCHDCRWQAKPEGEALDDEWIESDPTDGDDWLLEVKEYHEKLSEHHYGEEHDVDVVCVPREELCQV